MFLDLINEAPVDIPLPRIKLITPLGIPEFFIHFIKLMILWDANSLGLIIAEHPALKIYGNLSESTIKGKFK